MVSNRNNWGGSSSTEMTVGGTVNKAALLMAMSVASAAITWMQVSSERACIRQLAHNVAADWV